MKNIVIAGAFLLIGACATPVFAQNQYVTIQTLTAIHEAPTIIDGVPYDPEMGEDVTTQASIWSAGNIGCPLKTEIKPSSRFKPCLPQVCR